MIDTIEIREFEESDLGQTLDVLRAALGETPLLRRTPELFSWKHIRNPFGRSIVLIASAGSRVVGVRAFMRWNLLTPDGETLRCVRAVDTATHPDFHRRGIFSRLTNEAVDRASEDGVDLIFNTPNPRSGSGYLKMGWSEVGEIGVMVRPSLRLLRRRPTGEIPAPDEFLASPRSVETAPTDREARGLRTPRSPEYGLWRFQQHPTARYFQVTHGPSTAFLRPNVRSGRRELVLSEVSGPRPQEAIERTIAASRSDYLVGWWSKGTPERRAAVRNGLLPVPRKVALTLVCRSLRPLPIAAEELSSWDLALSDLELL